LGSTSFKRNSSLNSNSNSIKGIEENEASLMMNKKGKIVKKKHRNKKRENKVSLRYRG